MIVAPVFDGDDAEEVALRQHDVYRNALRIIVRTCNAQACFARWLLEDEEHPHWGTIVEFDHRTLQEAHDLLAGAWRFENRQLVLRFDAKGTVDTVEATWLTWLRKETADWIETPRIVRSVQLILTNQNHPKWYAAESQLCLDILARFAEVPWKAGKRERYEAESERYLLKIQEEKGEADATTAAEDSEVIIPRNINVMTL